ncbi:NEDD4-binding protein 1 [Salvelinus sp. IW2-2015]|uniref:NEDD4-binding protein 1 n=1 Tax=Salvelinus sp. IW2-2015 TaxID=2691554 RepID=UPI000CDF9B03|nr:NEDD4-binding protein 1 [Salvelinus alpinus]
MSTTRPLLGMKRVTEVTCKEPLGNRLSPTASKQQQEALTVDEFAVFENKQEELKCAKPRVEQVFRVAFTIIGLLDTGAHSSTASRQIWLQLKGKRDDVSRAKEYLKGLCDPELQQEEHYPVDMHCIFAGARGLFLDRLLRDTSAEVVMLEPGTLRLLGCFESVIMAKSRVQQFVALFQEKRSLPGDREPAVKRTFKTFVEERDDKYAMELLLLPSALKEELLGLAQSPTQPGGAIEVDQDRSQSSTPVTDLSNRILDTSFEDKAVGAASGAASGAETGFLNGVRPSHKRRSSESELRDTKRQYSLERRDESMERERHTVASDSRAKTPSKTNMGLMVLDSSDGADDGEAVSPETNLRCLVNFFRTMGYQQEVVERVVKETGQTEDTFLLLECIVEESQRTERQRGGASSTHNSESSSSTFNSRDKDRGLDRVPNRALNVNSKENIKPPSSNGVGQRGQYSSMLQTVTLKRSSSAQGAAYDIITINDDEDNTDTLASSKARMAEQMDFPSGPRMDYLSRGGAQTMGPVRVESVTALRSTPQRPTQPADTRPGCSYQTLSARVPPPRTEPAPPPLTATTRFHDSLRNPYTLTLQNEPGCPDLRHIIIDGSNVAMAHGLHRFFSCRGIAIAVEAFWRQGHREITVFVPQWRQKRDRYTTEQHYLNQLEDLRLLSFTPSREVCGQRISSHDDRFLLHLAEKTGGVIVTNDNLRDFVNTSEAWMRIIQERLLQFTFVEDHFMIPDDPLGKHGPHLEVFLRKDNRRSPVTPPLRPDPRATPQPVFVQALQSAPRPSSVPRPTATPQMRPLSHWPHSGPPGWHPPCPTPSPPLQRSHSPPPTPSPPPQRSPSETIELKRKLYDIFPDQKQRIDRILSDNPYMRDLNALSGLLLG